MTNEILDIDKFIELHDHIMYCEAILFPDGNISYAVPSHIARLLEVVGLTYETANNVIPNERLPLEWLVEKTGCIPIW